MRTNIELKARVLCSSKILKNIQLLGAFPLGVHIQKDIYLRVPEGRLKIRQIDENHKCIIYYNRINTPGIRKSDFEIIELDSQTKRIAEILGEAMGTLAIINKERKSFELGTVLINLDDVKDLGKFVEIEVDVAKVGDVQNAWAIAEDLKDKLEISLCDTIPWSYLELAIMQEASVKWRKKINSVNNCGLIFLVDGVSCSGKTTLVKKLSLDPNLNIAYVPRYCTRQPRNNEEKSEYIFVSHHRFVNMAQSGAFIEYRDFKFGMSYGSPWKQFMQLITQGKDSIGIMNLGNIGYVREIFPEAITILVHAPVETIRRRLLLRCFNTLEQVEERVESAQKAEECKGIYHHVVENDDGMMDIAYKAIKDIILMHRKEKLGIS